MWGKSGETRGEMWGKCGENGGENVGGKWQKWGEKPGGIWGKWGGNTGIMGGNVKKHVENVAFPPLPLKYSQILPFLGHFGASRCSFEVDSPSCLEKD